MWLEAMAAEAEGCWASLPQDLVRWIAGRILAIKDRIRFRAVCRSWRLSTADGSIRIPPLCLMLADKPDSNLRSLCGLGEDKKVMELDFPEMKERRCLGSRFGWLLSIGPDLRFELFNPFSRARLPLPPSPLSMEPDPKLSRDLCVGAGRLSSIGFCEGWDKVCTLIDSEVVRNTTDAIFFKGTVYNRTGRVCVCVDLDGPEPKAVDFAAAPPGIEHTHKKYLADVGGHLFLVARTVFDVEPENRIKVGGFEEELETGDFDIFKLVIETREWEEITCIGDWALFFGNNCSFGVAAFNYPGC